MKQPVIIPWTCLGSQGITKPSDSYTIPKPNQKTFVQIVNNICDIPISQLPKPSIKGDMLAVTIPEEEYLAGLET